MLFVEASEIVPNLWQGSFPEPGPAVGASGFKMLVLCAQELQEEVAPRNGYPGVLEIVYAPNYDDGVHVFNRQDAQIALMAARRVAGSVHSGNKTLVTCAAGLNRSGLVVGLTLHLLYGWDGLDCVQLIKRKRPSKPGGMEALSNMDFVACLLRLKETAPVFPVGLRRDSGFSSKLDAKALGRLGVPGSGRT